MNDISLIQLSIIIGMIILMILAIIIDGEIGKRVLAVLLSSFGFVVGYMFRKAQDKKEEEI